MDLQTWAKMQLNWRQEPGLWLLGSVLLALLVSNASWLTTRGKKTGTQRWICSVRAWYGTRGLALLAHWVYLVAPLYALLMLGIISPQTVGLVDVDWVGRSGRGMALTAGALALLSLGRWSYRRVLPHEDVDPVDRGSPRVLRWLVSVIEAAALQLHWSFFRSGLARLGWAEEAYWSDWASLALVALEWGLNPWFRQGWRSKRLSEAMVRRAVLAVVTTALFILTRNLWLCWALHALFEASTEPAIWEAPHGP